MNENQPIPDATGVSAMLMLEGGNQCELSFESADAPLLRELFEVLLTRSHPGVANRVFKIPIDDGKSSIYFPSESLVAIATDPPMLVDANGLIAYRHQQAELPSNYLEGAQYVQIDNFLSAEEHAALLKHVMAKESELMDSTTLGQVPDYRKSKVIYLYRDEFYPLLQERLPQVMPEVLPQLGLSPFDITHIECQLTAHNDGHYYKIHPDNGTEETSTRQVSYVYYFNREPKAFSGGELRLYDSKAVNGTWVKGDNFKDVEPRNNSIVFFCSSYWHEVMPVSCPSRQFADSRFTFNGWVRR